MSAATEQEIKRLGRLALPAVSVQEWAELHHQSGHTAKKWATGGELDAWKSGGVWLVRPGQPVPPPKPQGAAAHRKQQS